MDFYGFRRCEKIAEALAVGDDRKGFLIKICIRRIFGVDLSGSIADISVHINTNGCAYWWKVKI